MAEHGITLSTIQKTPFGVPTITITRDTWAEIQDDVTAIGLDPAKVAQAVAYLEGPPDAEAQQQVAAVANVIPLTRPQASGNAAPAPTPQPAVPAAPAAAPQGEAPMCAHGQRVWFERTPAEAKAQGKKPFKAWMCPSEQGDPTKCKPQWA